MGKFSAQTNYRIQWDIPEDDETVKLGIPSHHTMDFDGEDGQRRALEHLQLLRAASEQGMCSNITVQHREVLLHTGEWVDGEPS